MDEHPSVVDAAEEKRLYDAAMRGEDEPIHGWPDGCRICGEPVRAPGISVTCGSATCRFAWGIREAANEPEPGE